MSEKGRPIYVVLSTDDMTMSRVEEVNYLTRELEAALEEQPDYVQSVSTVDRVTLPEGAKVAGELVFAQQLVLELIPVVAPWVLQKIASVVKSYAAAGKRVKATVHHGGGQIQITPETSKSELTSYKQTLAVVERLGVGRRLALVIGNAMYQDKRLPQLNSSIEDAEGLARVLEDPRTGSFTLVEKLINQNSTAIKLSIERFFREKEPEDLLLLYYSGHGIRSGSDQLFLAAENTAPHDGLNATGVPASFIIDRMNESPSERKILILDCCYGGAIVKGAKADQMVGQSTDSVSLLQKKSGSGSVIIAGSEAMQYAFDGQRIEGHTENSVFTKQLINGLQTGEADTDRDGLINVNELYQYAYKNVRGKQTPNISTSKQVGQLFIGYNPKPTFRPAALPKELQRAVKSKNWLERKGAVSELIRLLDEHDPSAASAAESALEKMATDELEIVAISQAAREALDQYRGIRVPKPVVQPVPPPPVTPPIYREPEPTPPPKSAATSAEPSSRPEPSRSAAAPAGTTPPVASNKPVLVMILVFMIASIVICILLALASASGY
jgi:hypothetical protein